MRNMKKRKGQQRRRRASAEVRRAGAIHPADRPDPDDEREPTPEELAEIEAEPVSDIWETLARHYEPGQG